LVQVPRKRNRRELTVTSPTFEDGLALLRSFLCMISGTSGRLVFPLFQGFQVSYLNHLLRKIDHYAGQARGRALVNQHVFLH
jgi:hypothetical protein